MTTGDSSSRQIRALTALVIVGVFTSGAVVGAGIHRWGSASGPANVGQGHGTALWLPPGELELTPEQEQKVSLIVDRHRSELEAIVRESFPRVRAINEQMQAEVKAVLTPEQRAKFEQLKKRGPGGPTPTRQKRLDDFGGEPPLVPPGPARTP
jgi:Spy/CpxP family protein refolding chaperone